MSADENEAGMRTRISIFLPKALSTALCSYEMFLEQGACEEAKDFKAHHDACKSAITHLELIIKLAEKIGVFIPNEPINDTDAMADLIHDALAEVRHHKQTQQKTE